MPKLAARIANLDADQRSALIDRASTALTDHECIVLPSDTLYGLFTRADQQGIDHLDTITGKADPDVAIPMTLHLADLDQIMEHLVVDAPAVDRLLNTLLPGPARIVLEQPESAIDSLCSSFDIPRSVIDDGNSIAFRVPDHPICRQVIRTAGVPTVARRIGAAIWALANDPGTDLSAIPEPEDRCCTSIPYPQVIIDDGQTLHQTSSTTVNLSLEGKIQVDEGGALTERDVLSKLERTIIFVCTGNTCRSPMAEHIAKQLIADRTPNGIVTHIRSAGVAAANGAPAADNAIQTLAQQGIDASGHESSPLTLEMIDRAELIYTMTPSHAHAVMSMAPNSVHKVFPLCENEPVPDPIGQSLDVYQHTADRLKAMITTRFEEIRI